MNVLLWGCVCEPTSCGSKRFTVVGKRHDLAIRFEELRDLIADLSIGHHVRDVSDEDGTVIVSFGGLVMEDHCHLLATSRWRWGCSETIFVSVVEVLHICK